MLAISILRAKGAYLTISGQICAFWRISDQRRISATLSMSNVNIRMKSFHSDIANLVLFNTNHDFNSLDEAVGAYHRTLLSLIDKHAPLKAINIKPNQSPWWNERCRNARREKMRAFRKSKKKHHLDPDLKSTYREKCIDSAIITNQECDLYYENKLSSFQDDPRSTYKIVNRLLDKECGSQIFPNGESDENLANAFGNIFDSKVHNVYAGIEAEQCLPDYTPTRNTNSDDVKSEFTEFDPVSDEEL